MCKIVLNQVKTNNYDDDSDDISRSKTPKTEKDNFLQSYKNITFLDLTQKSVNQIILNFHRITITW